VGLGLKAADRSINIGWWVFAAFLSDLLLAVFAWLGLEEAHGLADYPAKHYLTFTFPYSHGLLASIVWSSAAASVAMLIWRKQRPAWIAAGAVFSHFVLDAIVHVPGLPVAGAESFKLGLGLWTRLPVALTLEVVLVVVALGIYLRSTDTRTYLCGYGVAGFVAVLTVLLVTGQAMSNAAPPRGILIPIWMVPAIVFGGAIAWLDRKPGYGRGSAKS
jgi:hypothetical protein